MEQICLEIQTMLHCCRLLAIGSVYGIIQDDIGCQRLGGQLLPWFGFQADEEQLPVLGNQRGRKTSGSLTHLSLQLPTVAVWQCGRVFGRAQSPLSSITPNFRTTGWEQSALVVGHSHFSILFLMGGWYQCRRPIRKIYFLRVFITWWTVLHTTGGISCQILVNIVPQSFQASSWAICLIFDTG